MIKYRDGTYTQSLPTDPRQAFMIVGIYGHVDFNGYPYQLPYDLTKIGGWLVPEDSPTNNERVIDGEDDFIILGHYDHPLPVNLIEICGSLDLKDYRHPLPESLQIIRGNCNAIGYPTNWIEGIKIGGYFVSDGGFVVKSHSDKVTESPHDKPSLDSNSKLLPPWIIVPEVDVNDRRIIAVYRNGRWMIVGEGVNLSLDLAILFYNNFKNGDCIVIENLLEQIKQSSLK